MTLPPPLGGVTSGCLQAPSLGTDVERWERLGAFPPRERTQRVCVAMVAEMEVSSRVFGLESAPPTFRVSPNSCSRLPVSEHRPHEEILQPALENA